MLAFGYISLKKTIATYITELIDICLDDFASTQLTNKLLKIILEIFKYVHYKYYFLLKLRN